MNAVEPIVELHYESGRQIKIYADGVVDDSNEEARFVVVNRIPAIMEIRKSKEPMSVDEFVETNETSGRVELD